jgi:hypothetical protein
MPPVTEARRKSPAMRRGQGHRRDRTPSGWAVPAGDAIAGFQPRLWPLASPSRRRLNWLAVDDCETEQGSDGGAGRQAIAN